METLSYCQLMQRCGELEAQLAAVVAENAALSKFIDDECYVYGPHDVEPVDAALEKPETPATDAFLAEVRAQGLELFFDENPAALGNGNIKSLRERFLPKIRSGEISWGDYLKRKDTDLQEASQ